MAASVRPPRRIPWNSRWLIGAVTAVVAIAATLGIGLATGLLRPGGPSGVPFTSPSQTASEARTPTPASAARTPTPPRSPSPIQAGCSYPTSETVALDAKPTFNGAASGALVVTENEATNAKSARKFNVVDTQGRLVGSVAAAPHSLVSCDPGTTGGMRVDVFLPWTSTSTSRVYYLDGDSELRFFAPADGTFGRAKILAGGPSSGFVFSVSPDDSRIAVARLDYSQWPVRETLYVEDMSGGNHVDFRGLDGYYWPVGWHGGQVVLEGMTQYAGYLGTSDRMPRGSPAGYRLFDPASNMIGPTLGQIGCRFDGSLPSPAGLVCFAGQQVFGVAWDGTATAFMDGILTGGGALSSDGSTMAACCFAGPRIALLKPGVDPALTEAKGYVSDGGWLDATHVIYRVAGTGDDAILDTVSGAVTAPLTLVDVRVLQRLPAAL